MSMRTAQISLRMSPILKARGEIAAACEGRSFGSLMERLLEEHLRGGSLADFHARVLRRFEDLVVHPHRAPVDPRCYRQLSFAARPSGGPGIAPSDLIACVRDAMRDVGRDFNATRLFEAYARPLFAPRFVQLSDGGEVLESILDPKTEPEAVSLDYWCASTLPSGSHLKAYDEDAVRDPSSTGRWLSPFLLVREVWEMVGFARQMTQRAGAGIVEFRCEWWGLAERRLHDPHAQIPWRPCSVARSDHRLSSGRWSLEDLRDPADAVAALAGPVLRLFDPQLDCDRGWVLSQAQRFRS